MKFHFKLKCKEFPYRLSMCTVLKKFNLTLLKVVKYIESFFPGPPSIYETVQKYR